MTDSSDLIDKLYTRIEIKREHLLKERNYTDLERSAWGDALEWCHNTLCALVEAEEPVEIPEMPDTLQCEGCDD